MYIALRTQEIYQGSKGARRTADREQIGKGSIGYIQRGSDDYIARRIDRGPPVLLLMTPLVPTVRLRSDEIAAQSMPD